MFRNILSHLGNVSLEDIVTINVGHFTGILQPDLVFGVLGNEIQSRNVQSKLASLGKLSKANTQGNKIITRNTIRFLGNSLAKNTLKLALTQTVLGTSRSRHDPFAHGKRAVHPVCQSKAQYFFQY